MLIVNTYSKTQTDFYPTKHESSISILKIVHLFLISKMFSCNVKSYANLPNLSL